MIVAVWILILSTTMAGSENSNIPMTASSIVSYFDDEASCLRSIKLGEIRGAWNRLGDPKKTTAHCEREF